VMDTLAQRGSSETKALKLSCGYAQPRQRVEFDRAMKELQARLLVLKVEERYDPFTYVWDTVEHHWSEQIRNSRSLSARDAAYQIVRRYFEIAAFGSERAVGRILGIDPALVELALSRLEREHFISRHLRVAGMRDTLTLLAVYA